jgi:hypothetical protein
VQLSAVSMTTHGKDYIKMMTSTSLSCGRLPRPRTYLVEDLLFKVCATASPGVK